MKWDKNVHDFKIVRLGSTHTTTFKLLDFEKYPNLSFVAGCSCTTPSYDDKTGVLSIGLKMNEMGIKNTTITVKRQSEILDNLVLKANIQ